jgi:hypothetical protein
MSKFSQTRTDNLRGCDRFVKNPLYSLLVPGIILLPLPLTALQFSVFEKKQFVAGGRV